MGHQNLQLLLEQIRIVLRHSQAGTYRTVYLAAAGSESSVMQRFAQEVATQLGLRVDQHEGDLLLRVRRPLDGSEGWEVLIRLAPRPLSVRPWRVCDLPGALNAAVAQVMILMTRPRRDDVFLNLACGSGTLLIERASAGPASLSIGCDIDPHALECARANLAAGRVKSPVFDWNITRLPLANGSVNVLCSDLPFGHDVGSHDENLLLYPRMLKEAARVAAPGGRAVFLSHELRLMESILSRSSEWELVERIELTINGLHPHIYSLVRRTE
jgi:23S rRNA G2445 N2-methylase RlmL